MTEPDRRITDEITATAPEATLREVDGRWVLTMTRFLRHPAERVWPMLTEVDQLQRWSPIVADRPLESRGPATSKETPEAEPVDAEVLVHDAPHELVHRWGPSILRWTLTAVPGGGTKLTLEQTFDDRGIASMSAAGWHICLAVLAAWADGHNVERVIGPRATDYGWPTLRDRYDHTLATVPGLRLTRTPVMRAQMLIRRPVAAVFEAFVEPSITTKFWFTKSTGRLGPAAVVDWTWEMYDVSTTVRVQQFDVNRRILATWDDDSPTELEWRFLPGPDETTICGSPRPGSAATAISRRSERSSRWEASPWSSPP